MSETTPEPTPDEPTPDEPTPDEPDETTSIDYSADAGDVAEQKQAAHDADAERLAQEHGQT